MTDTTYWLIANLDLAENVFSTFSTRMEIVSPFYGTFKDIHEFEEHRLSVPQMPIGLILLFQRRLDPGLPSVTPALSAIEHTIHTLEHIQVKHAVQRAILVDCAEMPNAPLSDFNVLGQYFEILSNSLSLPDGALIAALDYNVSSKGEINTDEARWWDTRSNLFIDHMRNHISETLRLLNGGA